MSRSSFLLYKFIENPIQQELQYSFYAKFEDKTIVFESFGPKQNKHENFKKL